MLSEEDRAPILVLLPTAGYVRLASASCKSRVLASRRSRVRALRASGVNSVRACFVKFSGFFRHEMVGIGKRGSGNIQCSSWKKW